MTPLIELINVSKRYTGAETAALQTVSLRIERGEFVAIVGVSGAGKSSLLNIIGLLDTPTSGEYLLDGRSVRALGERGRNRARAEQIGFVFQSSNMLGDEFAVTNASLGLRIRGVPALQRRELAVAAIEQVGMSHRADARAKLLSGGEAQRLALARAIAGKPALILADEPTGNLDSTNGRAVMGLLSDLHQAGHTVLVITHDPSVAARADRQITIADGLVADDVARARPRVAEIAQPLVQRQSVLASWVDTALDAISALSSRPVRTLLLVLAFAIGVAGLVTSSGLSQSAAAQVSNRLTAAALDEVRVNVATTTTPDELSKNLTTLDRLDHVERSGYYGIVAPNDIHVSRTGPLDPEPAESVTVASPSASYIDVGDLAVTPAHSATLLSAPGITRVALVSTQAAADLHIATSSGGPAPGVTIWVDSVRVSVIGTFEPSDRTADLTASILVSSDVLATTRNVSYTLVVRTEPGFPAAVAKAIPLALDPANPGSITTQTVADLQGLRIGVADDLSVFVVVLAGLLLALAAVSGATAMYLSVHSRTAEIALRRALGTSRSAIAAMFVWEGLCVGLAGGVVGAAAGLSGVLIVAHLRHWDPVLPAEAWAIGIIVGGTTALISAAYPAWLASRQNPAQAIRA